MNAKRDQNHIPTIVAVQDDGATITAIQGDPSNHGVAVSDASTGSDNGGDEARDDNHIPVMTAVSSADGITPVVIYADTNGKLLIDSN